MEAPIVCASHPGVDPLTSHGRVVVARSGDSGEGTGIVLTGFPLGLRSIIDHVTAADSWDAAPLLGSAQPALFERSLTPSEIVALAEADAVLAIRLLSLVNQPYFGMPGRVYNVRQAIELVGADTLQELLARDTAEATASGRCRVSSDDRRGLHPHSLGVACASRVLARVVCPGMEHTAYTVGLVHEIGAWLLEQTLGEQYSRSMAECPPHRSRVQHEETCFGVTHAEVGEEFMGRRRLPAMLARLVGAHHIEEPPDGTSARGRAVFRVLRVAMQCGPLCGSTASPGVPDADGVIDLLARLDPGDPKALLARIEREYAAVRRRLSVLTEFASACETCPT